MYNNTKLKPPPPSASSPSSETQLQQLLPPPEGTSVLDRKTHSHSHTPKFKSISP